MKLVDKVHMQNYEMTMHALLELCIRDEKYEYSFLK